MKFNDTPVQEVKAVKGSQYSIPERQNAIEFPMMIVISIIYPCNFGCPECPYHDDNSNLRKFYRANKGDYLPQTLWNKMADEAGPHGTFMRCTGGGEPFMHPKLPEMVEYAKGKGCRVWINTNGSRLGPDAAGRERLRRVLTANVDLIEFSMDAGDAETYSQLRPPITGAPKDPQLWFDNHVGNIRAALQMRKELKSTTRIVVSMIRQKRIETKLQEYIDFYVKDVGVDEVITRKFLSWDDNTKINLNEALDPHLYKNLPNEKKEPCVWPFERLNVDTLGRVALCGQDISFKTAGLFPNVNESSLKDIWQGERFNWYRRLHIEGNGTQCFPCKGCSAWLAGIRDSKYGWLQVLKKSGDKLKRELTLDTGAEIEIFEPDKSNL